MGSGYDVAREASAVMKAAGLSGVRFHERQGHPSASWFFSCEEPDSEFKGVGGEVLFEADLMVDEADDYDRCMVERSGALVVGCRYRVVGRDVTYVGGTVAACERGSAAEKQFIEEALEDFMERAVGPVASIVEGAKKNGIKMSARSIEGLLKLLSSVGEHHGEG